MLEFTPEGMNALRARYKNALADAYDSRIEGIEPPSGKRKHVFDTISGIRMIISRDIESDGSVYLHLSASINPNTFLHDQILSGLVDKHGFRLMVLTAFRQVSRDRGDWEFCGFTKGKGVPHWRRKESEVFAPSGEAVS